MAPCPGQMSNFREFHMKKALLLAVALLAATTLSGCAAGLGQMTTHGAGSGLLWSDTVGAVGLGSGSGSKSGQSTSKSILGLVAYGDSSIQAAAQSAGITRIASIDRKFANILGIYAETTTIVYGD